MDINRIDGVHEPSLDKTRQEEQRQRSPKNVVSGDQISISPEAQKAAEVSRLVSLAKQLPDVRPERLAQSKERLDSQPPEADEEVSRAVARRMMEELL